jgi:hypothetical protein
MMGERKCEGIIVNRMSGIGIQSDFAFEVIFDIRDRKGILGRH